MIGLSGLRISNSTLGINSAATLTVDKSWIEGNSNSSTASGGGIRNTGNLTLRSSTVANNRTTNASTGYGGGIFNDSSATLVIHNSTIAANVARQGGGIYNNSGALAIHNSTISANQATDWGGGIFKTGAAPLVANSIIRGNSAPTNPDVVGAITSQNSSVYLANTADPGQPAISLYALGSYGGTMPTMPPLAGSPALALGRFVAGELDLDQVGAPRPSTVGAVIDAGAVQGQGYTVTIASPSPFPAQWHQAQHCR